MFKKISKISFIVLMLLIITVVFFPKENQAADRSPDVIGLRIIPNPDHLSALKWYQKQKFIGSPQSLIVDGYEAVRDGRTVYINVANIDSGNNFYTNINVISYNQEAESATLDIFGQIINHWKFNTNIDELVKSKIIKDTARLNYLADIKNALENYKSKNGYYPKLSAGSYLANKTISTWPSWQGTLGKELGIILPIDPVNKLGFCTADYNESTCWNNKDRKFSTTLPGLPQQSQVFYYSAPSTGASYNLCAVMTSGYINRSNPMACEGSNFINHDPIITFPDSECPKRVKVNRNYNCHVKTADIDNDIVTFVSFLSQPADFSLNFATGVISGRPTSKGTYIFKVAVKDNLGAISEAIYNFDVYTYCGDNIKENPNSDTPAVSEQCDGTDKPEHATCAADCTSWQCDIGSTFMKGYHKEGNSCVINVIFGCANADINASTTYKSWSSSGRGWGSCRIESCKDENLVSGYHIKSSTENVCVLNEQNCLAVEITFVANASSYVKYWDKNSGINGNWGPCQPESCKDTFHIETISNIKNCVSNTKDCTSIITNASSAVQKWDKIVNNWGSCELVSCNSGYANSSNSCKKNNAPTLSYSANSNGGVIPNLGTPDQIFVFEVIYKDANNDAPIQGNPVVKIFKNGIATEYPMTATGTETYVVGKLYRAEIKLSPHIYSHSFAAKDSYGLIATGAPCSIRKFPYVAYAPVLSEGTHTPNTGTAQLTNFTFNVKYTDQNMYAPYPGYPKVHILQNKIDILNSPFAMGTTDASKFNGDRLYKKTLTLPYSSDAYTYYFEAENYSGVPAVSTSEYLGPVVTGVVKTAVISGTIKDYISGTLIQGAIVQIEDANGAVKIATSTDSSGKYYLKLTEGKDYTNGDRYKVVVKKTGFSNGDSGLFSLIGNISKVLFLSGDLSSGYGVAKIVLSKRTLTENVQYESFIYVSPRFTKECIFEDKSITTITCLISGRGVRYSVFSPRSGVGGTKIEIFNSGNVKVKEYLVDGIYGLTQIFSLSDKGKISDIASSSPYVIK
ncbi:MAG: carboxypeptidase-like regulatory domain-containing protein [Patescibacteria group bacterium]